MKFATSLLLATSTAALKLRLREGPFDTLYDYCDSLDGKIGNEIKLKDIKSLLDAARDYHGELGSELIPPVMNKLINGWTDDEPIDSRDKKKVEDILNKTCEGSLPESICGRMVESLRKFVQEPAPTKPETTPETNRPDTPPAAEKEEGEKPSPQDMAEYAL